MDHTIHTRKVGVLVRYVNYFSRKIHKDQDITGNCTSKTCPSMYDLEERNPLSLFKPPSDLRSPKFAAIFALDEDVEDEDRDEIQAKISHGRLSSRTGDGKRSDI